MRNYVLSLELSFLAESEATKIMDACADMVKELDAGRETNLVQALEHQVKDSIGEIEKVVTEAQKFQPEIISAIKKANDDVERMRAYRQECEAAIKQLHDRATDLVNRIQGQKAEIEACMTATAKRIDDTVSRLREMESFIQEAQQRAEAAAFIRDMAKVNGTLMGSGKAVLLGKDDLGNLKELRKWDIR